MTLLDDIFLRVKETLKKEGEMAAGFDNEVKNSIHTNTNRQKEREREGKEREGTRMQLLLLLLLLWHLPLVFMSTLSLICLRNY